MLSFNSTGTGNQILEFDSDTYISFNPCPVLGGTGPETAICHDDTWFILSADFREQYTAAANDGGFDACMKIYQDNKADLRNQWSTD